MASLLRKIGLGRFGCPRSDGPRSSFILGRSRGAIANSAALPPNVPKQGSAGFGGDLGHRDPGRDRDVQASQRESAVPLPVWYARVARHGVLRARGRARTQSLRLRVLQSECASDSSQSECNAAHRQVTSHGPSRPQAVRLRARRRAVVTVVTVPVARYSCKHAPIGDSHFRYSHCQAAHCTGRARRENRRGPGPCPGSEGSARRVRVGGIRLQGRMDATERDGRRIGDRARVKGAGVSMWARDTEAARADSDSEGRLGFRPQRATGGTASRAHRAAGLAVLSRGLRWRDLRWRGRHRGEDGGWGGGRRRGAGPGGGGGLNLAGGCLRKPIRASWLVRCRRLPAPVLVHVCMGGWGWGGGGGRLNAFSVLVCSGVCVAVKCVCVWAGGQASERASERASGWGVGCVCVWCVLLCACVRGTLAPLFPFSLVFGKIAGAHSSLFIFILNFHMSPMWPVKKKGVCSLAGQWTLAPLCRK